MGLHWYVMVTTGAPRIVELANQLVEDILRRDLDPGDTYLSTADAARLLGVRTHDANRAMQLLVKRNVLERRQRLGTFIGPGIHSTDSVSLSPACVHLVLRREDLRTEGLMADGVLVGLQGVLPSADIQFNFLPVGGDRAFIEQLIVNAARNPRPEAFILLRTSLEVQRCVEESGMPAVIYGTPSPSVEHLPFIDRDHRNVGRMLVDYLWERGVKHFAILLRDRVYPGDHFFLDGIQEALERSGVPQPTPRIRCLPADDRAATAVLKELLDHQHERFGVVCRSEPLGNALMEAATASNVALGTQLHIAVADVYGRTNRDAPFAYARACVSPEEIGAHIGEMLVEATRSRRPNNVRLSVEIIQPQNTNIQI